MRTAAEKEAIVTCHCDKLYTADTCEEGVGYVVRWIKMRRLEVCLIAWDSPRVFEVVFVLS